MTSCAGVKSKGKDFAVNLQRNQVTLCKEQCFSDYKENCYQSLKGKRECTPVCPLESKAYLCLDLYKNKGVRAKYTLSPKEFYEIEHFFSFYSNEQVSEYFSQVEFLCSKRPEFCDKNNEGIKEIQKFITKENK